MGKSIRILYVDDNLHDHGLVRHALEKEDGGFQVIEATSRADFESKLAIHDYDLVLSDFNILGFEGLQVLDAVKEKDPRVPVVIVTGTGSEEVAVEAMKRGAADYVIKTLKHIERLPLTIKAAIERQRFFEGKKQAEMQVHKLSMAVEQSSATVVITDTEGNIEYVNPKFTHLTGYKPEEVIGENIRLLKSGKQLPEFYKKMWNAIISGKEWRGEFQNKKKNGEYYWELASISAITDENGVITNFVTVKEDITERKRAEGTILQKTEELNLLNKELHELALEMTKLEDKERKRFAEMLHEGIGQNLVSIKMFYSDLLKKGVLMDKKEEANAEQVLSILDETIQAIRSMTTDLYPLILGKLGLVDVIEWYAGYLLESQEINVGFDLSKNVEDLTDELKSCIVRFIRECFQNILKHASATRVKVICKRDDGHLRLLIKDNGVGFLYGDVKAKPGQGIGLILMREWLKSLQGSLNIKSQPGRGTEIIVELPVETG